ncbi:phosphatase PAP2 family protein [Polyangium mundeleinium]|uniref:Phosphatase PAP2 family protein n=1 Tax=Polyangium mundeleinium TaxID=2995306 RepID=A0ABT5EFK4_9BACT|nr:phosphatase PAP2 family protein [Polyangium mundeleinium]MDC0740028.1 phosphatase PAP2 family protein [Polyangium mundeleinium]
MSSMPRFLLSFAFVTCLAAPGVASAQEPPPARPMMRVNLPIDLTVIGVGGAAWITTEVLKSKIAPATCRWCSPPGFDDSIARALRWSNTKTAARISDVGLYGLAPLAAFGFDAAVVYASGGTLAEWGTDVIVLLQSMVVAADLTQIVKFSVARERPLLEYGSVSPEDRDNRDNNLSFFSGHTSFTFSAAVSAGTLATLKGYRAAPWIWATGLTIATATGYLRMAADKHYFSDVMVGAIVGSAVGFVVPWLHRPSASLSKDAGARLSGMMASPLPGGGPFVGFSGILD